MVEGIEKISGQSMDIELSEKEKLKSVFPQCFNDGKLDVDKLLNLCGEYIENDFEKYKFEWSGKSECYKIAGKRSTGTLRPCKEESVNFDTTKNLYIEGDNLEVLKLLQTAYFRKIKMIYIDPPYNTGNDFVYEDDFKDPIEKYKEITQQTTKSNPETMGRFHTNWLNMMYPRLRLAANLLRDDGVIFISIDDNEVTNLRRLCDEVFGEENFVACFTWKRRSGANDAKNNVSMDHEYVVCYARSGAFSLNGVIKEFENYTNPDNDPRGPWTRDNLTCGKTASQRPNLFYPITDPKTGIEYACNPDHVWRFEKARMEELIATNKVIFPADGKGLPAYKRHKAEVRSDRKPYSSIIDTRLNSVATKELRELLEAQVFDYPKTTDLLKQLIYQATNSNDNDIILDFFSGSATTAHAIMQLNSEDNGNRKFIMVQLPEKCGDNSEAYRNGYKNLCKIGQERIRRAGKKLTENADGQLSLEEKQPLDVGFKVFKLDTSNLAKWDSSPLEESGALFARLHEIENSVKKDRSPLDVVYEVMLKLGVPLDFPIKEIQINDKKAYSIGENCLVLVCIDYGQDGITPEDVEKMCEYLPAKIVSTQQAFKDDVTLSNAHYILKDRNIEIKLL